MTRSTTESWRDRIGRPSRRSVITIDDFMTGLLASLAADGVETVSMRDQEFYRAVADAFTTLQELAEKEHVSTDFSIAVNPVYGDSPDVRQAITRCVQRDLVSLDNPEYQRMRLKIDRASAWRYLSALPGQSDMYNAAADEFLSHYPNFV